MRINLTKQKAEELAADCYAGDSKPLSNNSLRKRAQELKWWQDSPRKEGITPDRKDPALRLYLKLAAHAEKPLKPNSFPAAFDLIADADDLKNRAYKRPDKGVIKACLLPGQQLIRPLVQHDELTFELTETARKRLGLS